MFPIRMEMFLLGLSLTSPTPFAAYPAHANMEEEYHPSGVYPCMLR